MTAEESDSRGTGAGRHEGSHDASDAADTYPHSSDQPRPHQGADLARQALEQAKADARRRGAAPGRRSGTSERQGDRGNQANRAFSGRDPLPFSGAIEELVADRGWEVQAAVATVFARWPDIVGAELAVHTQPERVDDGELLVVADSPAWATQVRLLSANLVRRLREELGETTVRRVRVQGPSGRRGSGRSTGIPGARGR